MSLLFTKAKTHHKASIYTMSESCRNQLLNYINEQNIKPLESVQETEKSIKNLPLFVSGCFTYLQAKALAEYLHR